MIQYKKPSRFSEVPDLLTISRSILGIILLFLATMGKTNYAFTIALGVFVIGIVTDVLDGVVARKIEKDPSSIGKHDINFDMALAAGYLFFLGITGFLAFRLGFTLGIITVLMAILPENNTYKRAKRLIQVPGFIAITIAIALNFLKGFWLLNIILISIAAACLVFDRKRATDLAQERKENLLLTWQEIKHLIIDMTQWEKYGYFLISISLFLFYVFPATIDYIFAPIFIGLYIIFSERHKKAKEKDIM
jgi:phosphatidylserine synthase